MKISEPFAPENEPAATRRPYKVGETYKPVPIRYEVDKTYTYTAYIHAAGFTEGHQVVSGAADSQHREYAIGSGEVFASIDAAAGQAGDSYASVGMLWRLRGITPTIHNDPRRTCTIKTTMTYTLIATGDQDAVAEVYCFDGWNCGEGYSDTVTGAPTSVTRTVTKTVKATHPLKKFFYVMGFADGIHGVTGVQVECRNNNTTVPEQATASATVSSISLTFNPVKIIPEPF